MALGRKFFGNNKFGALIDALWIAAFGGVVESGGKMSVAVAKTAIDTQAEKVVALTNALAEYDSAVQQIVKLVSDKEKEIDQKELRIKQLLKGVNKDNPTDSDSEKMMAARELVVIVQALGKGMPELKDKLQAAQSQRSQVKAQFTSASLKLKEMKATQKASEATARVTAALEQASSLTILSDESNTELFNDATAAIARRSAKQNALMDVNEEVHMTDTLLKGMETDNLLAGYFDS